MWWMDWRTSKQMNKEKQYAPLKFFEVGGKTKLIAMLNFTTYSERQAEQTV